MLSRRTEQVLIDHIDVEDRLRATSDDAVAMLAKSMADLGLRTPITVRIVLETEDSGALVLVAGATRLAAAKSLGWTHIDAFVVECDETEAKMWEIAENLHRAELTKLERAEQIAEWVRLSEGLNSQIAKKRGRPSGGVNAAAKELGIDKDEAYRAVKISEMTPEAKAAAVDAGLSNSQSKLLKVASEPPANQVAKVREIKEAKDGAEVSTNWRRGFERVWNRGSEEDRQWAKEWIDRPIMDARYAG